MADLVWLSLGVYGLAIAISLVVALMILGIVKALPLLEGRTRPPRPELIREPRVEEVPAAHIAAIGAAVAACVGEHHILHIEDRGRGAVWTAEGRMMHHTSHALNRRRGR